jgi:hypothetical protein
MRRHFAVKFVMLLISATTMLLATGQYGLKELLSSTKIEKMQETISVPLKLDRVETAETEDSSSVLDDRWHSSEAFRGAYRDEFHEGLEYYLKARGFVLTNSPKAVLVRVTLDRFEGRKRVSDDGGDLHGTLTLVRDGQVIGKKTLFESLSYRNQANERPVFAKQFGLPSVSFATVLFYRLSLSFYQSIDAGILDALESRIPAENEESNGETPSGRRAASSKTEEDGTGVLSIESIPDGAEILLDGKLIGTTPANHIRLRTGDHSLLLRRSGYDDWARDVTVLSGNELTLKANLVKASQ